MVSPVAKEESYFFHEGAQGWNPAGRDHCTGRGRSPEAKGPCGRDSDANSFRLFPGVILGGFEDANNLAGGVGGGFIARHAKGGGFDSCLEREFKLSSGKAPSLPQPLVPRLKVLRRAVGECAAQRRDRSVA